MISLFALAKGHQWAIEKMRHRVKAEVD